MAHILYVTSMRSWMALIVWNKGAVREIFNKGRKGTINHSPPSRKATLLGLEVNCMLIGMVHCTHAQALICTSVLGEEFFFFFWLVLNQQLGVNLLLS